MRPDILIVGQGLAGTLLAWEFERAGISFAIADAGSAAATSVAAGIINPITGRRLVKSWRIDALLPAARAKYRELETALGVALWRDLRVRRRFADDRERRIALEKQARGEFAPFVLEAPDDAGFWIEGAARVDLAALVRTTRERWKAQGRWRAAAVNAVADAHDYFLVIDCTGASGARSGIFDFVPWEFSKGEILALSVEGLTWDVLINCGHWVLPVAAGAAWVGATHEPKFDDASPSLAGRAALEASAKRLLQVPFTVTGHFAGVRVNLPDKRPVAGRHPRDSRMGLVNGLGAKGALWAPPLARQWVNHLTEGVPFDVEISLERFSGRGPASA
jgi:glycine/D-amino acid oxidase-like deaminating enzyme